ncbi:MULTISPECIES: YidB family protein [unclassified Rhizobium]|uniref:YidB family protein n=1 Tax=unclassified Rhizobium TaxID=2613769 RepID=UPI0006F6BF4F|nr:MULTISPECIES: YidB family protein [unclassified Rhizobium]KQV37656.1 hypothetical protein ASC86_23830 [Rhizobium sp. Root1212]KRD34558.1 hypothetical protein ASE37_22400 [Rhizobium sp. Root268]
MASNALKALLGVLAVAGYQNRDKIAEILRGLRTPSQLGPDGRPQSGGLGDLVGGLTGGGSQGGLGGLGGLFGGGIGSGGLAGGLGDLLKQFQEKGHGDTANSWVQPGENKPIDGIQLSEVLGPEILSDLSARTGLSGDEILSRLSRDLPRAVDDLTPDGQVPSDEEETFAPSSVPSVRPTSVQGRVGFSRR